MPDVCLILAQPEKLSETPPFHLIICKEVIELPISTITQETQSNYVAADEMKGEGFWR